MSHAAGIGAAAMALAAAFSFGARMTDDPLQFTITAPREVRAGAPVTFTLRLTNTGTTPAQAYFLGREITFDVVVADSTGAVVWRRLEGAVIPGILQVRTLAPGETLEFRTEWRQRTDTGRRVAAGEYDVWGLLPSDAREPRKTPSVNLRIVPRY